MAGIAAVAASLTAAHRAITPSTGGAVQRLERVGAGHGHVQVLQQAVVHAEGPAVDGDLLARGPGVDHHGADAHVDHLLDHVEVAQRVGALRPRAGCSSSRRWRSRTSWMWRIQLSARPMRAPSQRGLHAAAAVVADHHDVLDLEHARPRTGSPTARSGRSAPRCWRRCGARTPRPAPGR